MVTLSFRAGALGVSRGTRSVMNVRLFVLLLIALLLPHEGNASRRKMYVGNFPVAVGSRWTYTVRDSVRHRTDTAYVRIIGSKPMSDGKKASMWRYRYRGKLDTEYVALSGDTVTFYRSTERQSAHIRFIFPLVPGKHWSLHPPGSTEVQKIMTVETPAGVFRHTFKVRQQPAVRNFVGGTSFWLEPWVGFVQIHYKSIDTINNQEEDSLWQLLAWTIKK